MSEAPPLQELDTCGLLCPMPVIRTAQAIAELTPGDQLRVIATDPGTMQDIPAWCRVHHHELLRAEEVDPHFVFEITVKGD